MPCLTVSYITLLEYSCTAERPADCTSRAHDDVGNHSAGQTRGDISVHIWGDNTATTKIEAINYVSGVFFYLPQLKGNAPGTTRLLVTHLRVMPSPYMTDVSLFLCCWSFIVCFAQGICSKFATCISPSWSSALEASLCCPKRNLGNLPPPVNSGHFRCILGTHVGICLPQLGASGIPRGLFSRCNSGRIAPLVPKLDSQTAAGTLTASSAIELPHISTMRSKNTLLQVSKIPSSRLSSMASLHLGRLRRPSSERETRTVDTVRGRLEQEVRHASNGIATCRSGLQKQSSLLLQMWVLRPQVNGG